MSRVRVEADDLPLVSAFLFKPPNTYQQKSCRDRESKSEMSGIYTYPTNGNHEIIFSFSVPCTLSKITLITSRCQASPQVSIMGISSGKSQLLTSCALSTFQLEQTLALPPSTVAWDGLKIRRESGDQISLHQVHFYH